MKLKKLAVLLAAVLMTGMLYTVGATVYGDEEDIPVVETDGEDIPDETADGEDIPAETADGETSLDYDAPFAAADGEMLLEDVPAAVAVPDGQEALEEGDASAALTLSNDGTTYCLVDNNGDGIFNCSGITIGNRAKVRINLNGLTLDLGRGTIQVGATNGAGITAELEIFGGGTIRTSNSTGCIVLGRATTKLTVTGPDIKIQNDSGNGISNSTGANVTINGIEPGGIEIIGSIYGIWCSGSDDGAYTTSVNNAKVEATGGTGIYAGSILNITDCEVKGTNCGICVHDINGSGITRTVATITDSTVIATNTDTGVGILIEGSKRVGSDNYRYYNELNLRGGTSDGTKIYGTKAISNDGWTHIDIDGAVTLDGNLPGESGVSTVAEGPGKTSPPDPESRTKYGIYSTYDTAYTDTNTEITIQVKGSATNFIIQNMDVGIYAKSDNGKVEIKNPQNTTGYNINVIGSDYGLVIDGGTLTIGAGTFSGYYNGVRIESTGTAVTTFNISGNPNITCSEGSITGENYQPIENKPGLLNENAKDSPLYQVADIFLAGDVNLAGAASATIKLDGELEGPAEGGKYSVWANKGAGVFTSTETVSYNKNAWGDDKRNSKFESPKSQYFTYDMILNDDDQFQYIGTIYVYFDFIGNNGNGKTIDGETFDSVYIEDGKVQNIDPPLVDGFMSNEDINDKDNPYYPYIGWIRYTSNGTFKDQRDFPAANKFDLDAIKEGSYNGFYWVGYTFEGWYTGDFGENPAASGDPKSEEDNVPENDFTLHAYWKLCEDHEWVEYDSTYHICEKCLKKETHEGHLVLDDDLTNEHLSEDGIYYATCEAGGNAYFSCTECETYNKVQTYAELGHQRSDEEFRISETPSAHWTGECGREVSVYDSAAGSITTTVCDHKYGYIEHDFRTSVNYADYSWSGGKTATYTVEYRNVDYGLETVEGNSDRVKPFPETVTIQYTITITQDPKCYEDGKATITCDTCRGEGHSESKVEDVPVTIDHNYEYSTRNYLSEDDLTSHSGIVFVTTPGATNTSTNFDFEQYHYIECQWFDGVNCKHTLQEEHDTPDDPTTYVPPTCQKEGYKEFTCNDCLKPAKEYIDPNPDNHAWVEVRPIVGGTEQSAVTVDPDWEWNKDIAYNFYHSSEEHYYFCTNEDENGKKCGAKYENSDAANYTHVTHVFYTKDKLTHYDDKTNIPSGYSIVEDDPANRDATCQSGAIITIKCNICEEKGQVEIGDPVPHDFADWHKQGDAPSDIARFIYEDEHWSRCTFCEDAWAKEKHNTEGSEVTGSADGEGVYHAVSGIKSDLWEAYDLSDDELYEQYYKTHHHQECYWCHEDVREEHTQGDIKNYTAATCQAPGSQDYECTVCKSDINGVEIPVNPDNHAWVEVEFITNGAKETRTIDPNWKWDKGVSCNNFYHDIKEHYYFCTNEGEGDATTATKYKGSDDNTWVEHTFPTAISDGVDSGIYAIKDGELKIPARCETPEYVTVYCTFCEEINKDEDEAKHKALLAEHKGTELGHVWEYKGFVPNYDEDGVLQNIPEPEARPDKWYPDTVYGANHSVDLSVSDLQKYTGGFHWHECVRYETHDAIQAEEHNKEDATDYEGHTATCLVAASQSFTCPDCDKFVEDFGGTKVEHNCLENLGANVVDKDEDHHYIKCQWYGTSYTYENASLAERDGQFVVSANGTTIYYDISSYAAVEEDGNVTVTCKGTEAFEHTADTWKIHNYEDGYEEEDRVYAEHWQVCEICGEEFNKEQHRWSEWTPVAGQEPNCLTQTDGKEERNCSDCGAHEERDVDWENSHKFRWTCLLDPDLEPDDVKLDLSNMDKDNHWLICTVCDLELNEGEEDTSEGHVLSTVGEVIEAATETKTGLMKYPCTAEGCEYYETKVIPVVTKATESSPTQSSPTQSSPTVTTPNSSSTTSSSSTSVTPATDENGEPVESSTDPNETTPVTDENGKPIESSGSDDVTCATNENGDPVPPGSTSNDDPTVRPPTTTSSDDGGDDPDGNGGNGGGSDVGGDGENGNGRPNIENSFGSGISSNNGAGSPGTSLGSGRVIVGVDRIGDAPEISIDFATAQQLERESINKHISDDEKATIRNGTDMRILLTITNIIKEQDLTDVDKELIETFLANSTYTEGQYLDISLIKYLNDVQVGRIFQLDDPIAVSLMLPDVLRSANRSYAVVRLHSGSADLLYDLDSDPDTITILTDKFSTYVIVYRDYTPGESDANANNPYTGIPWAAISMLAFAFPIGVMTYIFSKYRVR